MESSGQHAETIKGTMDEKAETVMNGVLERDVKSYNRMCGCICITVLEKNVQNDQDGSKYV